MSLFNIDKQAFEVYNFNLRFDTDMPDGGDIEMDQKSKKRKRIFLAVWLTLIALILVGIIVLWHPAEKSESIKEVMLDGVLHEKNKISLFGLEVNPGLISAYVVTAILLIAAAVIRIFAIPKFRIVPGKFQILIEKLVGFFTDMAGKNIFNYHF